LTEVRVVLITVPDERTGLDLARSLVGERLAACVNILPGVRSVYSWQGRIEEDPELLLMAKTQAGLVERLSQRVAELHPYDEPEVIALPVDGGSPGYLGWVVRETGEAGPYKTEPGLGGSTPETEK
jgi:periplasmic divalent cation tolerance protein